MSSRTNLNPKVVTVDPTPRPQAPVGEVPQSDQPIRDAYGSSGANPYRSLVSGHPRAISMSPDDSTPIGEMLSEIRGAESGPRMDPMQAFLASLIADDLGQGPSAADFELPNVPLLQRDILSRNSVGIGLGAIVQRYVALENVIINLINTAQNALNSASTSQMGEHEIESLREYKGLLSERLILCRDQLSEAQRAYGREQVENPAEERLDGNGGWWKRIFGR